MENLIGKNALVVSKMNANTHEIKVGDMVEIIENDVSFDKPNRMKVVKCDDRSKVGFFNLNTLQIIEEESDGYVFVEIDGFKAEGQVTDILTLIKGLREE